MSKPPLRAVLPRRGRGVRPRARTFTATFTTLPHFDLISSSLPSSVGRSSGVNSSPSSSRLPSSGVQLDASSPTSPSTLFSPSPLSISHAPQHPPTPPLPNSGSIQPGPRSIPLPPPSSGLPNSIGALPPLSPYSALLGFPSGTLAPVPAQKPAAPHFSLHSAAFGIPKHPAPAPNDVGLHLSVQVGEDAYFLLPHALGVSDGVGGWRARGGGAGSALFARRLMHFCADELLISGTELPTTWSADGAANLSPVAVLERAFARALAAAPAGAPGSGTALLGVLLGDELRVAHLGDCALLLVRGGRLAYRSAEQQHRFNHPLQLGPSSATTPMDAARIALPVRADDIVVLASDGLGDNLWDADVLDEVAMCSHTGLEPRALAEALCSRAKRASARSDGDLPFARRARAAGVQFQGGKPDDISVLVAVVSAPEQSDASGVEVPPLWTLRTAWSAVS